jgi:hypothetical protein
MEQVTSRAIGRRRRGPRARALRLAFAIVLGAIALGLLGPLPSPAAEEPSEYQVKAVFLLNFIKFMEWPPAAFMAADSPITICILGEDPFGRTLDETIAGEAVNGRKVAAQRIKGLPPPRSCQVLFIQIPEKDVRRTVSGLGPGVLTVGEGRAFLRNAGMIAFTVEDRHVRFDINRTLAERAGLRLSSKLLSVARTVE